MALRVMCIRCKAIVFAGVPELAVTDVAALYDHVQSCVGYRKNDPSNRGQLGSILRFFEIGRGS